MTRSLNTKCYFKNGFFSCNLPVDAIQVSVHVDTKRGKHTLREDRWQRTERYRSWNKHSDGSRQILDSMTVSDLSDSGDWLPSPEPNYRPKLFHDARNPDSSKENMLPHEQVPMSVFNAREREFLNKTEKLLGTGDNWESHVAQQIPLPKTSSPTHTDKQLGLLEQLVVFTEDEMDTREFSERPANGIRPPKPPRKTKNHIQDVFPPPRFQNYMAMNHPVMGNPRPPLSEIRSLLMEKRKVLIGWPACLKRSPQGSLQ